MPRRRRLNASVAGLMTVAACLWPPAGVRAGAAVIHVRPTEAGQVNRRVLGKNVLGHVYRKGSMSRQTNVSMQGSGLWDPRTHEPVASMMQFLRATGSCVLRWPGGCGAHEYNWKLTVGPLAERPNQAFGLPEFLRCCRRVGAEPILTLADFWGEARDFADLVEYLNAPAGANPNGGKDWAAVRAADGRPEPYGVVWFECGNETYHGNHRGRFLTTAQYGRRYRRVQQAMKAVDPRVKLGAVLENGHHPDLKAWTREVVTGVGDTADFFVHHAYLPGYSASKPSGEPGHVLPAETLYELAFASARQFDMYYTALNRFVREKTGRRVPLAVTELNGGFVQGRPKPYRLCLGTAVQVADLLQVLLQPRCQVDNAEYWQFSNEYWGMIRGYEPAYDNPGYWRFSEAHWGVGPYRPAYLKLPAFYVYKLYNDCLGRTLLDVDVSCTGYDTPGGLCVMPAHGRPSRRGATGDPARPVEPRWRIKRVAGAEARMDADGVLCVDIRADRPLNYYHADIPLTVQPGLAYKVTAEIRTNGVDGPHGAAVEVQDARGFDAVRSYARSAEVRSREWTAVECAYDTRPDATGVKIIARRLAPSLRSGARQGACRFWVRNLTVQPFRPWNAGRVPHLAALATRRADRTVSVVVVNRNIRASVPVRITGAAPGPARAETLSGPSVDATNEVDPNTCILRPLPVRRASDGVELDLPPHSVTGVWLGPTR